MTVWDEIADSVYRRRFTSLDLNVGLVLGEDGALVVDTRQSQRQARELLTEISQVTSLPVRWVVNTHYHWDHVFGNAEFAESAIWGHVRCREYLEHEGERAKRDAIAWLGEEERAAVEEVVIVPPQHVADPRADIDIGGRVVSLVWLGRGHTDSDVVVTVSDADVLFAGDLLENGAPPVFGDGFPLAWRETATALAAMGSRGVVPGHGDTMTRAEVATQVEELTAVAALCREGLRAGTFDANAGPYPEAVMRTAFARAQLEATEV